MTEMNRHNLDLTNPVAVANGVLGFLKEKDLSGIISLLNDANRQILYAGRSRKFLRGLEKKLEKTATMFARVDKVSEIREMYHYEGRRSITPPLDGDTSALRRKDDDHFAHSSPCEPDPLVLAGKIRQDDQQLHAVALTREGNRYFFDQLISTHVLEYERWQAFSELPPVSSSESPQKSLEKCFAV